MPLVSVYIVGVARDMGALVDPIDDTAGLL